jgi:hypothetical protein
MSPVCPYHLHPGNVCIHFPWRRKCDHGMRVAQIAFSQTHTHALPPPLLPSLSLSRSASRFLHTHTRHQQNM